MPIYGINETFSEEEWDELQAIKIRSGLTWHNFIIKASKDWDRINRETNQ